MNKDIECITFFKRWCKKIMDEFTQEQFDNDLLIQKYYLNLEPDDTSDIPQNNDIFINYLWVDNYQNFIEPDIFVNYANITTKNDWKVSGNFASRLSYVNQTSTSNPIYNLYKRVIYKERYYKPKIIGKKVSYKLLTIEKNVSNNINIKMLSKLLIKKYAKFNISSYISIIEKENVKYKSIINDIEQNVHSHNYLNKENILNVLKSYIKQKNQVLTGCEVSQDEDFIKISAGYILLNNIFFVINNPIKILKRYLLENTLYDEDKIYYLTFDFENDELYINIMDNDSIDKNNSIIFQYFKVNNENISLYDYNPDKNKFYDINKIDKLIDLNEAGKLFNINNEFIDKVNIEKNIDLNISDFNLNTNINYQVKKFENDILEKQSIQNNFLKYNQDITYKNIVNNIGFIPNQEDIKLHPIIYYNKNDIYNHISFNSYDENNKLIDFFVSSDKNNYQFDPLYNKYEIQQFNFYQELYPGLDVLPYNANCIKYKNYLYILVGKDTNNNFINTLYKYDLKNKNYEKDMIFDFNIDNQKLQIQNEKLIIFNNYNKYIYNYDFENKSYLKISNFKCDKILSISFNESVIKTCEINIGQNLLYFQNYFSINNDIISTYEQTSDYININFDNIYMFDENNIYYPNDDFSFLKLENGIIEKNNMSLPINIYNGCNTFTQNNISFIFGGILENKSYNPYIFGIFNNKIISLGINKYPFLNSFGYGDYLSYFVPVNINNQNYIQIYSLNDVNVKNVNDINIYKKYIGL